MAVSRDDILVAEDRAERPLRVQLAAFVPITIAVLGVALVILGGAPASRTAVADGSATDPVITGSVR